MDDQAVDRIFIGDLNDLPPVSSKIVRIFTSSTFTDTSIERNTLMEEVYPKIKEYCREKHGLEFQVVDMRWGVRDEATDDHMTTDLCMREIKNCQRLSMGPNFVVFLGQKYGYRPIPTIILGSELAMLREALVETATDTSLLDMWYKLDTNSVPPVYILQPISTILVNFNNKRVPKLQAQDQATWWDTLGKMQKLLRQAAQKCFDEGKMGKDDRHNYFMSVTEREVINGVLNVKSTKNHCLAYFRYINNINTSNIRAACKYIDMLNRAVDTEAVRLLANLRDERVPAKLETTNIVRFHVEWIGKEGLDVDTHEEYLQQFITHFYKSIIKLVDRAMRKEDRSALGQIVTEILQHLQGCANSVKVFHGREEELARLEKYIKGSNNQPFVLHGSGGCGKTSLLAKVASLVTGWLPEAKPMLILRFLGTTPDSSTVAPLLSSLSRQIAYNFMLPLEEIPEEIVPLTVYLKNLLALATPDQGLAIFLDSVDQLASGQDANKMSWLPVFLPPNVKVVLSCVSDADCIADFTMLQKMFDNPDNFLEVKPLGQELALHVIREWLKSAHRDLTEYHWELVQNVISKCTLPIFVKLVFAEICRWKSYTKSQDTQLASNVNDSIMKLFDRIELQHGKTLVFHALAYITCAKSGLSESELEDIISLDDVVLEDVYQYHMPPVRRIPPLLWTRIRSDLPNYLSEREADGVSVLNWYHRQFRDAATERYFKNQNLAMYFHSSVADYFMGTWGGGTPKPFKFTELQRQRFGLTDKEGSADRKVPLQPLVFLSKDGKVSRYNLRKFGELPYHLVRARRFDDLYEHVFFKYEWLHAKLSSCPLQAVLSDFEDAHRHLTDKDIKREILLVADAMRLGGAILSSYPDMVAPQLIGRLLPEMHNNKRVFSLLEQCDRLGPKHCGLLPIGHCMHTPGGPLKYSLEGHQFAVFGFCLTSDNKYIVSVSNRFIIWDLSTSDISRNNDLNIEGIVQCLSLSRDDRFAAGYTNNNEIVLINALTGDIKHLYEFIKEKVTIRGLTLTESYLYVWSDHHWLQYDLTGKVVDRKILSKDKTQELKVLEVDVCSIDTYHVFFWTGEDENPNMVLETVHQNKNLEALPFTGVLVMNSEHNVLYTCIEDQCIQQMEISGNTWTHVRTLEQNEEVIQQLRLWQENGYILGTVMTGFKLWDLESERVKILRLPHDVRNISVKPMHSNTAAISKNNQYLVAGVRKDLYVWDMETEELLKTLDAHFGRIMQLVPFIDDEWNSVITSSIDRTVKVWNINNIFEQVHIIDRHDLPIDSISLSPLTNRAVTATRSCVGVWNMRTTKLMAKIVESPVGAIVTHAVITGNGRHLVTIENGNFLIWNVDQKAVIRRDEHKNVRQLLLFAKDTRALAVSRETDNKARAVVRSVPEGEKIYEMEFVYKIFRPMVVSIDSRYLVTMGYEKGKECLFVYEGHSGKFIHKVVPKYSKMKEVNHLVAMPNRSSYVTLVDVDKGTIIDIKNKKVVRSVARWNGKCTKDGKYGLYAPTRGGLELIELRHGNTVRTFIPRIAEGVYAVDTDFTKTDEYVLYYHAKHQTVRVFRVEDATMLANFKLPAEMTAIDCAPDGYSVIVGTADGGVTLLTIVDPEKPASREHLSRLPSRQDPTKVKESSGISFRTAARITQLALSATAAFRPGVDNQVKSKVCSLQ